MKPLVIGNNEAQVYATPLTVIGPPLYVMYHRQDDQEPGKVYQSFSDNPTSFEPDVTEVNISDIDTSELVLISKEKW